MRLLFAICLPLMVASTSLATTYVVRPDGTGDFPTIQAAIDASVGGDVIELTDGTFTGDGNRDIAYFGKAITVRSQSGNPFACTIDCQGSSTNRHQGFYFTAEEGPASVLEGISIVNGWSINGGGAIEINGAPTISNCAFIDNWGETGVGGAIFSHGSVTISDCLFAGNSAGNGSAVSFAVPPSGGSPTISGCTFVANVGGGGVILLEPNCSLTLEYSVVAYSLGASIYCHTGSTVSAVCCNIFGNADGDWVECAYGQLGSNGNISEDPLFCDLESGDFTIDADSPCAPDNSGGCGLIGALPVGCGSTTSIGEGVLPATWGRIKASLR